MIYLIIFGVLVLVITILALIGIGVKRKEKQFLEMFKEQKAREKLNSYKRKSTPKVPTIKK